MALATVPEVRRRGGLNHEDDYRLFRVADEAELDDMVAEDLELASAWISQRVDASYYTGSATTNTSRDTVFKRAECLVAMAFLTMPLKVRKVEGTHWAVDQEGSERFEELIDVEYLKQAELLIEPYATIDTSEAPFAFPVILATDAVDRSTILDVGTQYQSLIDESISLTGVSE